MYRGSGLSWNNAKRTRMHVSTKLEVKEMETKVVYRLLGKLLLNVDAHVADSTYGAFAEKETGGSVGSTHIKEIPGFMVEVSVVLTSLPTGQIEEGTWAPFYLLHSRTTDIEVPEKFKNTISTLRRES